MKGFTLFNPVKTVYGTGAIRQLNKLIPRKTKRVMVVTDAYLLANHPIVSDLLDRVSALYQLDVFSGIESNPSFDSVQKAARFARDMGSDLVIGLGGGSPMDAAKGVAMAAGSPHSIELIVKDRAPINRVLPIICIPTTSGTGSEVTPFAVFTDLLKRNKYGFSDERLYPIAAIIDPEMTYSMPKKLILHTGLDVLTHAVEAFISDLSFYHNDIQSLNAISMVFEHLGPAVQKNREAMKMMAYAAMLAGISIAHASTILPHIMGYPLTVYHQIPHGLASFLVLPAYLNYLKKGAYAVKKIQKLERVVGGIDRFERLASQLKISLKLSSYRVRENQFAEFAKKTMEKSDIEISPGEISAERIVDIYQSAM